MTPDQLRLLVTEMRALGVTECDGVKLGPVPYVPVNEDEPAELAGKPAVRKDLFYKAAR